MLIEDAPEGSSHHALSKLDPKQGHMKVNTPEGQLMPAKTVSERKKVE